MRRGVIAVTFVFPCPATFFVATSAIFGSMPKASSSTACACVAPRRVGAFRTATTHDITFSGAEPDPALLEVAQQAALVAGEHAAGPVGAVGSWREADDQQLRVCRAEAGNSTAPIGLVAKRRALLAGDQFAPLDQAWAGTAVGDLGIELGESHVRTSMCIAPGVIARIGA